MDNSTQSFGLLKNIVGGSPTTIINPTSGLKVRYDLIYLDVLTPSQTLINSQKSSSSAPDNCKLGCFETKRLLNEFSIIGLWRFGDFTVLTTGDIPKEALDEVVTYNSLSNITYLKIPHHGSKTSLTKNILKMLEPKIGVISVAKSNIYRLPNKEVIDMLKEKGIRTLRTDLPAQTDGLGTIEVVTDGKRWWVK